MKKKPNNTSLKTNPNQNKTKTNSKIQQQQSSLSSSTKTSNTSKPTKILSSNNNKNNNNQQRKQPPTSTRTNPHPNHNSAFQPAYYPFGLNQRQNFLISLGMQPFQNPHLIPTQTTSNDIIRRNRSQNRPSPQSSSLSSLNPQQNPQAYLANFFAGFGIDFPCDIPPQRPSNVNRPQQQQQDLLQNVHRHNFDEHNVYDNSFSSYGVNLDDTFRNNFSSNFRSNLERELFDRLMAVIQGNIYEGNVSKHPPTKKSVIDKLKKFELSEQYCKKNDKGEIELPNCCICILDIQMKEKTVLIPCGHLLHWKCGFMWLKRNNRCPVCRFELPGDTYNRDHY